MGFRFNRRIKIAPGVRLNISKSGIGASFGPRGASLSVGKRGVYGNVGLPGTGVSYRTRLDTRGAPQGVVTDAASPAGTPGIGLTVLFATIAFVGAFSRSPTTVIVFGVAALVAGFLAASRARNKREQIETARLAAIAADQTRLAAFEVKYGPTVAPRVHAGEVWIGQTGEQLRDARGEPEDIDVKVLKTKRRETWKYGRINARSFSLKVTLDNDVVAAYEER